MHNSNNYYFEILGCEVIYNKNLFSSILVGLKGDKGGMWREAESGRRENGRNEIVEGSGKGEKGGIWREAESGRRENGRNEKVEGSWTGEKEGMWREGENWKKGEWEK